MVAHCSSLFSSTCAIASLVRTMEEQAYMHTTTTQWPVLARIRPKIKMQDFFIPLHSQNYIENLLSQKLPKQPKVPSRIL